MTTFDQYYAEAKRRLPQATLEDIRTSYQRRTGNEPIFQQGPTRKEFEAQARSRPELASVTKDDIDESYDRIYGGGGIGSEAWRSAKRGLVGLGVFGLGAGEWAKDALGQLPAGLGNGGLIGAAMNADGLPDISQARKDLQEYQHSIPRSAASQGDVTEDLGQTVGNPLWWAGGAPEMGITMAPVIAGAAMSAPVGIPAYLGAGIVGGLMEGQSTYAAAKDAGLENPGTRGAGMGLTTGVLNAIPFAGTAGRGLIPMGGRMLKEAATEAAEEIPGAFLESPVDQWGLGTLQEGLRRGANVAPLAALGGGLNSLASPASVDNEAQLRELDQLAAGSRDQQFAESLPDVMSPYVAPPLPFTPPGPQGPPAPPAVRPSVIGEITQQAEPLREATANQDRVQALWSTPAQADSVMSAITGQIDESPVATPRASVTPPASAPVPTTMVDPAKVEVRNKVLEAKKGAVRTIVDPIISKWKGAPNLTIVGTREELPETVQQMFTVPEQNAVYDGNGNVFMVANDFKNSADVKKALFHESLGHYGIEQIVPDLARFSADIATMAPLDKALKPVWDEIQATYEDVDPTMRSLEVVARYAESHPDSKHPLVERFYASLRAFARKLGFTMQMNRADLNRMMRQAMRNLEQGGKAPVLSGVPKASRPTPPDLPGIPQAAPTARNPEQLLLPEVPSTDEKVIRVQQQLTRIAPIASPLHNAMIRQYTENPKAFQAKQRTETAVSHEQTREAAASLAKNLGFEGVDALAKARPNLISNATEAMLMASALEDAALTAEQANAALLRDQSPENMIIYKAALARQNLLMGAFLGIGTDAGRTLNMLQKVAGKVKDINQLMEAYVGDGEDLMAFAKKHAAAIKADETPESVEIGAKIAENSQAAELLARRAQDSQVERGQINTQIGALEQALADLERQAAAPAGVEAIEQANNELADARQRVQELELEIASKTGGIESNATELARLNEQIKTLTRRAAKGKSHLDGTNQRLIVARVLAKNARSNERAARKKDTRLFDKLAKDIAMLEDELKMNQSQHGDMNKRLAQARKLRADAMRAATPPDGRQLGAIASEIAALEVQTAAAEEANRPLKNQIAQAQRLLRIAKADHERAGPADPAMLNSLAAEIQALEADAAVLRDENAATNAMLAASRADADALAKANAKLGNKIRRAPEELVARLEKAKARAQELEQQSAQLEAMRPGLESRTEAWKARSKFLTAEAKKVRAQLESLRKQDEAMALREAGIEKNKEAVDAQRKSLAESRRKLKNGKAAAKAVKEQWDPTIGDQLLEVFYSNILSGTGTFLTNFVGTSTFTLLEESVKQIGLRLGGEGAEANARIRSMWLGATTGLRNAKEAFSTEQSQIDQQFKADNSLQPHGAIGTSPDSSAFTKGLGRIIRLPGRMLLATDEFWKGMAYTMEIAEIATRKSGGDLQMARYWMDNPTLEEQREAVEAARRVTFTSKLGESMGGLQRAINKKKAWKLPIPFVQTPTNIFYRAMDWSPLGLLGLLGDTQIGRDLKGKGGKTPAESRLKQRMAFTRQTLGGALVMMGWEMAAAGLLAGNGPPEKDAKELYMDSIGGALPRSFRLSVDSPWQTFGRYDPLAIPLSIIADMHYAHSVATDLELKDIGLLLMASFVTNMADKTWLHGVSTAVEALQSSNQQAQQLEYFASTIAGGFIPTNLVAQTLGANDKHVRDARTFTERLMLKIPGQREKLARQVDWRGQLRENPAGTAFGIALPSQSRESKVDPVAAELVQLGFDKRSPTRTVMGVELEPNEYEQWKGGVQKDRYELMKRITSSAAYKTWPREYKLEVLEKAWDSVTRKGGKQQTLLFWNNPRLRSELQKVRAGQ